MTATTLTPPINRQALQQCIKTYCGSSDEQQKACAIAEETIKKVIETHGKTFKEIKNPDELSSYILDSVNELLFEDETLTQKIDASVKNLLAKRDSSSFFSAVEWGSINYLEELFKQSGAATSTLTINPQALKGCVERHCEYSNEKEKASQFAEEVVRMVIKEHSDTLRKIRDPGELRSYILDSVNDLLLEDETLTEKMHASSKELLAEKDISDFSHAIEWGSIDYLQKVFKNEKF